MLTDEQQALVAQFKARQRRVVRLRLPAAAPVPAAVAARQRPQYAVDRSGAGPSTGGDMPANQGILGMGASLLFSILSGAVGFVGTLAAPLLSLVTGTTMGGGGGGAHAFVAAFEAEYGDVHPAFMLTPFTEAVHRAAREGKVLVVYLHSEFHAETAAFCEGTLSDPALVPRIDESCIAWAGDIAHQEAHHVSTALRASTYPYLALVVASPQSNNIAVLAVFEGNTPAETILAGLQDVTGRLDAERAARDQEAAAAAATREADRRIRAEQDAAYEASLAADLFSFFMPGPDADADGVVTIRVRLPDGAQSQRRFVASHKVQHVYAWIATCDLPDEVITSGYVLVANFPRTLYTDRSASLADAGLVGHVSLFVEATPS
ncbi:FAS-associated factor 1 [Thecamonas trahens ATCC 50062]|uniref:FAS-associated factor 1 n=1 Tax=Thecamonas trahens ATCC 50062 TaxID=461836 RepID=A0A0L0DAZ1_THETB|nr:FAS-associated factor 1 [Thecamonas trahens ATCC 50062]KNC49519.1 FAS-associated factor 1 [Thecamonas trahens ATCC 50062]|eukprot:XP_013757635.1 FAS-associated factor 1 [Thecamonas trahens ATCC 50062]